MSTIVPVAVTLRQPPGVSSLGGGVAPVAVTLRQPSGISSRTVGVAPLAVTLRQPPGISSRVTGVAPLAVSLIAGGPRGPAGISGVAQAQTFDIPTPSSTWNLTHNLGRLPVIIVFDLSGNVRPFVPMTADILTATLSPNPPLAGKVVVL